MGFQAHPSVMKSWWKLSGDGSEIKPSDLTIGSILSIYLLVSFSMALSENRVPKNPMVDHHVPQLLKLLFGRIQYPVVRHTHMTLHTMGWKWMDVWNWVIKPLFIENHLKNNNNYPTTTWPALVSHAARTSAWDPTRATQHWLDNQPCFNFPGWRFMTM